MSDITGALVSIGFTEAEAKEQLGRLNDIIAAAVAQKAKNMLSDKGVAGSEADLAKALTKEELVELSRETSSEIVGGYFAEITKNLDLDKKEAFYKKVKELS